MLALCSRRVSVLCYPSPLLTYHCCRACGRHFQTFLTRHHVSKSTTASSHCRELRQPTIATVPHIVFDLCQNCSLSRRFANHLFVVPRGPFHSRPIKGTTITLVTFPRSSPHNYHITTNKKNQEISLLSTCFQTDLVLLCLPHSLLQTCLRLVRSCFHTQLLNHTEDLQPSSWALARCSRPLWSPAFLAWQPSTLT